jgi:hypothetical protein
LTPEWLREECPDNHLLSFKSIGDHERFGLNMAAMRNKIAGAACWPLNMSTTFV